jgi:hypothetical protein
MRTFFELAMTGTLTLVFLAGCSRNQDADVAKAKQQMDQAKAELHKAEVEIKALHLELARARDDAKKDREALGRLNGAEQDRQAIARAGVDAAGIVGMNANGMGVVPLSLPFLHELGIRMSAAQLEKEATPLGLLFPPLRLDPGNTGTQADAGFSTFGKR